MKEQGSPQLDSLLLLCGYSKGKAFEGWSKMEYLFTLKEAFFLKE